MGELASRYSKKQVTHFTSAAYTIGGFKELFLYVRVSFPYHKLGIPQ